MMKVLGGVCLLAAGAAVPLLRAGAYRRRMALLAALIDALEELDSEIRVNQTPLPRLLDRLCRRSDPAAPFFGAVASELRRGGELNDAWNGAAAALGLPERAEAALLPLGRQLAGDEVQVHRGTALAAQALKETLERLRAGQPDWEKRGAALSLSAAALAVILLA